MKPIQKDGKSVQFIRELNISICARMAVWVVSQEEERFLRLFRKIALFHNKENNTSNNNFKILSWSITEGLLDLMPIMIEQNGIYKNPTKIIKTSETNDKAKAMVKEFNIQTPVGNQVKNILTFSELYDFAMSNSRNKVYILKDIHNLLDVNKAEYAHNVRRIKDLIYHIRINDGFLIFLSPVTRICQDFEKDVQIMQMPRPDELDINQLLDNAISDMSTGNDLKFDINYTNNGKLVKSKHPEAESLREKIVQNLKGLTETEITQILAYTCVKNMGLQESAVTEIKDSKKQIIEKSGALQYIEVPSYVGVGGHEEFKKYIEGRGLYLNKKIKDDYNLKAPKGVLLVGIPGSGKSLLARYIGYQWNIPVIRLNFDSVFGKYVGESEDNLNNALNIAEANAPCILWIDELEKALGGNSVSGDSGTSLRVLGKVLTWMQEREQMVFMFATANDVSKLPPELQRAGRFDAKYWADLPTINECKDIFEIKIKENNFELPANEILQLANRANNKEMTGAEIEHVVIQSVYAAAVKSSKTNKKEPVTFELITLEIDDMHSHAASHEAELNISRAKALQDYTFTSREVRDKVIKNLRAL
jgi:SpoVK/Ycf46/Vps4 family AAA+-type ATPase